MIRRLAEPSEVVRRAHKSYTEVVLPVDALSGSCMIVRREVLEQVGLLDEAYFTTLPGEEPFRGEIEDEPFIRYGSCAHQLLDSFAVTFGLEGGTTVTLTERYREADSLFKTGPASIQHAIVDIAGEQRDVTDYFDLVYSASRHNTLRNYWVILDPPQNIAGVDEAVHAVALGAPEPDLGRPQPSADYFGAALGSIASPNVTSYDRTAAPPKAPPNFRRGDVNDDAQLDIADAIALLNFLFQGADAPPCPKAADTDDNGRLNITDVVRLPMHLFGGGPALQAPFPNCGEDPTPDGLECGGGCD